MKLLLNYAIREKSFRIPVSRWAKAHHSALMGTAGTLSEQALLAKGRMYECDAIIVSDLGTVQALTQGKGTAQNWAGSVLWREIPVLIISPLGQVQSTDAGAWLLQAHLNKLPQITKYGQPLSYPYTIVQSNEKAREAISALAQAAFIVEDIETSRQNSITSIAFTPISYSLALERTWVFNLSQDALYPLWHHCRKINQLPVPKVFHNGCFDAFHLTRWWMEPRNYWLDTEYMWHSWYAELKKSLAFVANTVLWDARFWKHEAATSPLKYNALDTINTARIFLYMLDAMPDWAWRNYSKLVPNIAPVVWCSFEGFKVDTAKLAPIKQAAQERKKVVLAEIRQMAASSDFNPGSWQQVSRWLYVILKAHQPKGRGKSASTSGTDTKILKRVALQHPLFARIISHILEYRKLTKSISTYYEARLTLGSRLLYSLNLDGTVTERFSCNASSLYAPLLPDQTPSKQQSYGTQLQNIPGYMKAALCADPGYVLINIDKSKSEAWCTAHISEDRNFLRDLEADLDFYLALGNRLFGLDIQDTTHVLRQVFKKINHSVSYMAGGESLLDSIGPAEVFKYMTLLDWKGTPSAFTTHCTEVLKKAYPARVAWWNQTKANVASRGYILTPDGHRRKVFGNPQKNATVWRSVVAHQPQHLSVAGLNEAFWKIWYNIQLPSQGKFRLKGQVHDSIVSQATITKAKEYETILLRVMDIPQQTALGELRIPLDSDISTYWKET